MQFIRGTIEHLTLQHPSSKTRKKRRFVYLFSVDHHCVKLTLNSQCTLKEGDEVVVFGIFKHDVFKAKGVKNIQTQEITSQDIWRLGFQTFSNFVPFVLFLTVFSDFFSRFKGQSNQMILGMSIFDLMHYAVVAGAFVATLYCLMILISTLNTHKKLASWHVN